MSTVLQIQAALASGARSAVQILDETVARIKAIDPALNSFTALTMARAQREAAAIDALRAAGATLPPLAGVPYAVKNLFDVQGEVTLSGGRVNAGNAPASADAALVTRMQQAGAILVGMLNMDEHAYGFTTENTHYGPTRNPHDLRRIAGGSSGGSGAAVAAALVPLTLGSDTNGSIRVPSSLCGVFGLKPTYGRLPRTGSFPFVSSLDHLGPFAANVTDLAAAYDVLQGPDAADHACAQRAVEPTFLHIGSTRPLRVAILGGWFHRWADQQAREAVARCAQALQASHDVDFPMAEAARSAAFVITGAEAGALHRDRLRHSYDLYEPLSRDRLVAGSLIPANWVVQAQRVRQQAKQEALRLFDQFDLLLAPATPLAAPEIGTEEFELDGKPMPARASMGILSQPISCIGLPVCTVPVWPAGAGMPIGVQLIAAPWREDLCLRAARQLEQQQIAQFRIGAHDA
ncbi:AtzE family amidohydrolase [Lacisediminimonas sp.]|uniref:AtzE family amidohydrolase n=1 Tax=Lacisediminimonas sp. TaxID=3060582 RepID=UPI002724EFBA|nr:AtzE family amidohydrolase [Lacisediminimonas sp.]MDO8300414.1 AtzE family amidohydrolase [Lacisediminimonas sp.]